MLRRPKPGDSEADLLRAQEEFLNSGAQSGVHVIRRPDKRRGEENEVHKEPGNKTYQRDVVSIQDQDLSDEMPPLTPAAPKKSRFKAASVHFEDEGPEECLDRHDTHVTSVLSRIIERDLSNVPVSVPAFTTAAFPKVFHRSEIEDGGQGQGLEQRQGSTPLGKRSIFAQKLAAQRARESPHGKPQISCLTPGAQGSNISPVATKVTEQSLPGHEGRTESSRLVSGQGLNQQDSTKEALKIHQENKAWLEGMSQREILEEQKRLLAQLDPCLVEFVRNRKTQDSTAPLNQTLDGHGPSAVDSTVSAVDLRESEPEPLEMEMEHEVESQPPITEKELPVKPQKEWLHMDKLEPEKLEWLRDLPPPRRRDTKRAMQARFDFNGILIPPAEDLPTHLGLHHHGEEPELAGYSLQELFHLSRSQVIQQRSLALTTLAHILTKAHLGDFTSCLTGSIVSSLLDAGLLFLLRFSLDDSVEGVMAAALHTLRALLVSPGDEETLDGTFSWFLGMEAFSLLPAAQEEEEEDDEGLDEVMKLTEKEKEERKTDHDVALEDVIKGLLRMKLLPRLRYILEVVRPSPRVVLDILQVLARIARHSSSSATQVLDCPRLMQTVMSEFLPCSWSLPTSPTPESLYGLPVAMAMKLLRVVATSGRQACARLLHSLGARERLSCLLALQPKDLPLELGEALRISTEALRLWAVAAGYGQACDLYRDLYPLLVKALQCIPRVWAPADPLRPLELQRLLALLTLLTNVTHTAGCHQELQSACHSSQDAECPPPPPVEWSHVTGLQPSILGWMKGCVRLLQDPAQRESALILLPPQLLYLGGFYSQLSSQNSFQPVECLQELEALTAEVLLPLLSNQATHRGIDCLRSFSMLCNPQSCSLHPESVPSLPGWGCSGSRSLAGSSSPLPLLMALCHLLQTVVSIHRGIAHKFSPLLLSEPLLAYLRACCQARPTLSHASTWLLRHEHHFLYQLLKLAYMLVPVDAEVAKHASLFHELSMAMVSWLLPGSEHLVHDLLATMVFNPDFIPEGRTGGPEAAQLSELQLHDGSSPAPLGPLLRDACTQLPSLRGCFLSHLAHLEPLVLRSRNSHLGQTPRVRSRLLPEASGPTLPSDWPFLPLVSLYEWTGGAGDCDVESLPAGSLERVTHCLQWLLVLESWREGTLRAVPPAAKLARLCCLFLCSSDLFLEVPVQRLGWVLLRALTRPAQLGALDLAVPLPGVASFHDLYEALLGQYEAVSFGDPLFGCVLLLPLQRRFSAAMRLAVFGEHVGLLRSLGVTLRQLPVPLEGYTSPPEDSLALLRLYFRALVMGTLRQAWCPVLYVVALAHLNAFIFSQEPSLQEVEAARRSLLWKTYKLKDEVLKTHLLLFKKSQQESELGFEVYDSLPPIRARRLEAMVGVEERSSGEKD
ncbi:RNA polymerase II-associated protein 1 [Conger conger]|uniref:RNA polymerase II-associated protein 1 n=1 Tax=Conger conger TaxID=82655 RepID=UPI002A5AFE4C|nr:RNA polymerase II-associated protein 1 [Conger conger]XP_061075268.1 RNA polymerase II-associated protein 1 [Conger conger]